MCMPRTPDIPKAPELPPERAAERAPDRAMAREAAGSRVIDRMRSATPTILTSGSGVTTSGQTAGKTLLGQ
jgi:hypothetical protein